MHVHQFHPARRKNPMTANPASGSACRWRSNPCEQRGDRLQSVGSLFVTEGIEAKRFPPPSAINTCWRHLGIHRFTHRSGVQQFPGRGRNENIVLLGRWRFGLTEVKRQIKPYGTTQVNGNRARSWPSTNRLVEGNPSGGGFRRRMTERQSGCLSQRERREGDGVSKAQSTTNGRRPSSIA